MRTHGEVLSREQRTTRAPDTVLVDGAGNEVFRGPLSSVTRPVETRHCNDCGPVEADGIAELIVAESQCPKCGLSWNA